MSANLHLSPDKIISGLRLSIIDGVYANTFANLTGSMFLPAFALALGASPFLIAFLTAVPFFATISQFMGSYLVERYNHRKSVTNYFALWARSAWLILTLLSPFWFDSPGWLLTILVAVVIVNHLLGSISGVAWMSWMKALVPSDIYGRYFGLRNGIVGVVGVVVTLLGGWFLDWYSASGLWQDRLNGFCLIFNVGALAGLISVVYLERQPDVPQKPAPFSTVRDIFLTPFREATFREMLLFFFIWTLMVNISSPFFVVFMLKDLELSYTVTAFFTTIPAIVNLVGMWFWGHFSDRLGNRPVIILTALIIAFLPALWIFITHSNAILLIPLLQIVGGSLWAGQTLCATNLVFRLAPREGSSTYFALWSALNGVAAGIGALLGGLILRHIDILSALLPLITGNEIKTVFVITTLCRLLALFFVRRVHEPQSVSVYKSVQVLMNVRMWAVNIGFHPLLHFFIREKVIAPTHEPLPYWPIWGRRRRP